MENYESEGYGEKPALDFDLDTLFLEYERMRDDVIKKIKSKVTEHIREKNNEIELLKGTLESRNKTIDETREKINKKQLPRLK